VETDYTEGKHSGIKVNQISSRKNTLIKDIRRLERRSYRDRDRLFVVEGFNALSEAVSFGLDIKTLVFVPERREEVFVLLSGSAIRAELFEVSRDLMDCISDVDNSQGVLGVMSYLDYPPEQVLERSSSMVLIADRVSDPGNLGALIRVADASGADSFIASEGSCDIYNRKVVRSTAGSIFHLPVVRNADLSRVLDVARSQGFKVYGLDPRGGKNYLDADLTKPFAIVVGNEAFGITPELRGKLDEILSIEMPGKTESLNVACSASVVLFEAIRQRRGVFAGKNGTT